MRTIPLEHLVKVSGNTHEEVVGMFRDAGLSVEIIDPVCHRSDLFRWSKLCVYDSPENVKVAEEMSILKDNHVIRGGLSFYVIKAFYKNQQDFDMSLLLGSELRHEGLLVEETHVSCQAKGTGSGRFPYHEAGSNGEYTPPHTPGTDW